MHQFRYFPSSVPGPPGDIKALPYRKQAILVSWKLPEECNGVITTYTLYQRTVSDKPNSHVSVPSLLLPTVALTNWKNINRIHWAVSRTEKASFGSLAPSRCSLPNFRYLCGDNPLFERWVPARSAATDARIFCRRSQRLRLIAGNPCFVAGGEELRKSLVC